MKTFRYIVCLIGIATLSGCAEHHSTIALTPPEQTQPADSTSNKPSGLYVVPRSDTSSGNSKTSLSDNSKDKKNTQDTKDINDTTSLKEKSVANNAASKSTDIKEKEEAVDFANKQSTLYPKTTDFNNSTMIYPLIDGVLYTVYTAPLKLTDLQFEKGESFVSISSGDTSRWQIAKTYSGSADGDQQWHLLIKPSEPNLETSLDVMTDRRTYHIHLISDDDTFMPLVKWKYPEQEDADDVNDDLTSSSTSGVDVVEAPGPIEFNYHMKLIQGGHVDWMPQSIYNDGIHTYIKFPKTLSRTDLPILKVAMNPYSNKAGNENFSSMVNYRIKGQYMVVDTVVKSAVLQAGVDPDKDKADTKALVWIYQSGQYNS